MASWKRVFASGLILIGPVLVTLYVVYRAYAIVAGITPTAVVDAQALQGVIDNEPTRLAIAHVLRLAISLTVFVLVTIGIGTLTRTTVGDLFARGVDSVANRLPGLRVVYNASKIAAETTIGEEQSLQEPVRVESWDGKELPAFKTGHTTSDGRTVLFIPTAPNISSGFVVEAEDDRITETDERVDEVLARVLSGGFGESTHPQLATQSDRSEMTDEE
ncbi:DUF502 domain-containing protein [Natrinema limicola]|uniref:DUF502 domain-containing protein n=1 Tax=Natrinema limicola JCM 13563 TaxID=1230457 RepID=M0CHT9_9EURY|nr:DUF502 domain-containing protein [Natrinema limicola]ELZ22193.1 hypothetical protein C476_07182 [Natrinema limicola JCM 13563]